MVNIHVVHPHVPATAPTHYTPSQWEEQERREAEVREKERREAEVRERERREAEKGMFPLPE